MFDEENLASTAGLLTVMWLALSADLSEFGAASPADTSSVLE